MFQLTRVRMWYICKSVCIPNICVRMSKSTLFTQPDITNLPRGSSRSARTHVEGFLFERLFGLLVLGLRPEIGLVNREVVNSQSRCWDKMLAVIPYWHFYKEFNIMFIFHVHDLSPTFKATFQHVYEWNQAGYLTGPRLWRQKQEFWKPVMFSAPSPGGFCAFKGQCVTI